jgi:DNA-binding transcriptional LysR family regulator
MLKGEAIMDFKQIEAFVNVVKYKSFSKAADALYLSQPTVSTHINTLEKELNVQLIDRHGKEALPTKQGMILYKYGVSMINIREKAVFSMNSASHQINGILEIQASSVPGEYIVPSLIAKFREWYPLVRFYLEQSDSGAVEDNLLSQKGEIGFMGYRAGGNLSSEKLMTDQMILIAPNNEKFRALAGQTLQIKDIINEAFIWREHGSATRREFEEKIGAMGYNPKQLNVVARLNSMEAIKQAVACGLGVSIISKIAKGNNLDPRILAFEIGEINFDRAFYLVWNKTMPLSPTADAFKNFVLKEYQR